MRTLSKQEARLLVYLESRAVDYGGVVDMSRMDGDETPIAEKWNDEGFIWFGEKKDPGGKRGFNHYVVLSEEAWAVSAADRKAIAVRNHRSDPNIPEAALEAIKNGS